MTVCGACGRPLTNRRSTTRYCTPRCRTRAYRRRLADVEDAPGAQATHPSPPVTLAAAPVTRTITGSATGCPYPRHRGFEWSKADGGPIVCGICHPPAVPDVVWASLDLGAAP